MTESQASEDKGEKVQIKGSMIKMSLLILKQKKNQCFPAGGQAKKRENGTRWDPKSMGTLGLWKPEQGVWFLSFFFF